MILGRIKGGLELRPRPGLASACRYAPAKLLVFYVSFAIDPQDFFKQFDDEIRDKWNDYKETEAYKHGKIGDHKDVLDDIVDEYRDTETAYNWKFLPGAEDDFSLLREYIAAYEPNVDRTDDITEFIEFIKDQPERIWYLLGAQCFGARELTPKPGLRTSARSKTIVAYAQFGGFEKYEGEEITIALEIYSGKEQEYFESEVQKTIFGRYFNTYSGDWINENGVQKVGFEQLSIDKLNSLQYNALRGCGARVSTLPWNGNAMNCPICGGWFNRSLDVTFEKDEVEGKTRAEILHMFAVKAGQQRREKAEKMRKEREQRRSTYEERVRKGIEKDREKKAREQKRQDAYARRAMDRCGKLGIDLGPDENGKEPTFLHIKQLLVSLLKDAAEQGAHRKHRFIEITLESVRLYYCYVLVDKDACDDVDANG